MATRESTRKPVKAREPARKSRAAQTRRSVRKRFDFDVALSFAGEDRQHAESLANALLLEGVRVFYDKYEQPQLWGKDLYQHLQAIYEHKARYCVIFASKAYARKLWTKHELRQAQARAFRESREYLLPLRLDTTKIPGVPETVGYIDLRTTSTNEVAAMLVEKLHGKRYRDPFEDPPVWDGGVVEFNGIEVASFWPRRIEDAQRWTAYHITRVVDRIRYGDEAFPFSSNPCHDCGVFKGQYHVPGCDAEECPSCGAQALSCDCDKRPVKPGSAG